MRIYYCVLVLGLAFMFGCTPETTEIKVYVNGSPDLAYGLEKLEAALKKQGLGMGRAMDTKKAELTIFLEDRVSKNGNDGYSLQIGDNGAQLSAGHRRGLLYGLLDIAEQLEQGKSWKDLKAKQIKAHYPFRAIKFNLPWFSYRSGENLALHYETCKDLKFWESFLDMMVENKFNTLTLWNLHPYMFMVQSDSFPKASPFSEQEMATWRSFWKSLFKMAQARGIEPYIFNWNIFVSEEFGREYQIAEYSKDSGFFGEGETNAQIEEYTREMVTKTINTYEDLAGIGITLGERMGGMTSEERRDWMDRTVIQGIREADRKVKLFYRAPLSAGKGSEGTTSKSTEILTREAIENIGLEDDVWLGFKFNWSHAHSSPKVSIVHGGILTDTYWNPKPKNYKGVWTMRNEDFFALRWAQPDFIRKFMGHNGQEYIGGCIIGSETYIPAKDYITKTEYRSWDYAFERQWLFYKVWGNLLYNSTVPDAYFISALEQRFALQDASKLLNAWKMASQNANRWASFYRGTWDATLYTEGMTTVGGKFIDVNQMIAHPVLDSAYVNIADFVGGRYREDQITPLDLARTMDWESKGAQEIALEFRETYPEKQELLIELNDIQAWGHFGLYVADKIRGAVSLQKFRVEGESSFQQEAVTHLENALEHWKAYTQTMETYNVSQMPYQFDQEFSWRKHIADAEKDIEIAKQDL
ncbi:MAG: hypothetical protein AAFX53_01495 [Bacteroidota bacterium]